MTPKQIAKLWHTAGNGVFSARVGTYRERVGPNADGTMNVYPMKSGYGFMFIVWRNDVDSLLETTEKCIRDGGMLKAKTFKVAVREALTVLLREYPLNPYSPNER